MGPSLWSVMEATGGPTALIGHPGLYVKIRPYGLKSEIGKPVKKLLGW